jgi:4-amino-4-deoxy-L-arabinose transferase-like glycosyltransferase
VWAGLFAVVVLLLVVIRFSSDDPDSALYAGLSARLAQEPAGRWIAPEWWGFWPEAAMTGLFREHPAGVFLLPTALTRVGIPAEQGAYVVGVAAGLASLLLVGGLVRRLTSRTEARAALVLLQLMPVAFIFRVRANHEYPMLLCLLVTLWGLVSVRRTWAGLSIAAIGMTAGLLIKGVFVVMILLAASLWILLNPTRDTGHPLRPWIALAGGLAAMAAVALVYDEWYARVTGETFWVPYWQRQLGPVAIASPIDNTWAFGRNVLFYASRLLWHPAPWSVALLAAAWRWRGRLAGWWREAPAQTTRGILFVLAFAALSILLLSPSSRFAERYAFSATYAIAAAGAVAACRIWPAVGRTVFRLDASMPAFPALVWFGLMLLRLIGGPILPRL